MRHDVSKIHRRGKAFRRLVRIDAKSLALTTDDPFLLNTPPILWSSVSMPVRLRTSLSPLPRHFDTLGLLTREDLHPTGDNPPIHTIQACFKGLRKAIRLLHKHARSVRRLNYGKFLLRFFAKRPNMALKSILRKAVVNPTTNALPTDLSIIKDETSGFLITNPLEVLQKIAELQDQTPPSLQWRRFLGSVKSGRHLHRHTR